MKKILFFLMLLGVFSLYASKWADSAFTAVEVKSASEVRRMAETDYSFIKYKQGENKQNVLMYALECDRDIDVVKALLKAGISPTEKDKNGKTVLMYACENSSDLETIKTVLEYGAPFKYQRKSRILKTDKSGNNCFDYAKMNEDTAPILELLGMYAEDPKAGQIVQEETEDESEEELEEDLETEENTDEVAEDLTEAEIPVADAIAAVATEGLIEEAAVAVAVPSLGLELEKKNSEDDVVQPELYDDVYPYTQEIFNLEKSVGPGLHKDSAYLYDYASNRTNDLIPQDLIKKEQLDYTKIDSPNSADPNGVTKLMKAAKSGDKKLIRDLIMSGADIEAKDKEGWTALMYAARYQRDYTVVKLLLAYGANSKINNNYGLNSIKLAAAFSKSPEVVECLITPFSKNSEELREAFVYGIKNSNDAKILQPFLDKKLQLNVAYNGKSYLMYAAEYNRKTDIIEMLLKAGAPKEQLETNTGKTAFDYAKTNTKLKRDSVYWSLNTK
ncbi:MAG: ankyrin repeat domain-containing protein [Treponema sp.]|nr:ankyrin repeat domain-containing protein [Candidatus Treponema equifaecale]